MDFAISNEELNKYRDVQLESLFRFSDVADRYGDYARLLRENSIKLPFPQMNARIQNIRPGEVACLISPTNVGKSSFAMNLVNYIAPRVDTVIPFFSLENSEYQMYERLIQMNMNVTSFEIEDKYFKHDKAFMEKCKEISGKYDNVANVIKRISIEDVIPYILAIKNMWGKEIGLVIVDYLQLVKHKTLRDKYAALSDVIEQLKEVSLHLRVPVFVLSQVGRGKDKQEGGLDIYSGKGSGEIENSSQILFGLERVDDISVGEIDMATHRRFEEGEIDLLRLKLLKKKRGTSNEDSIIIYNKHNLLMEEFSINGNKQEKAWS